LITCQSTIGFLIFKKSHFGAINAENVSNSIRWLLLPVSRCTTASPLL
jgi:hypothetical protein